MDANLNMPAKEKASLQKPPPGKDGSKKCVMLPTEGVLRGKRRLPHGTALNPLIPPENSPAYCSTSERLSKVDAADVECKLRTDANQKHQVRARRCGVYIKSQSSGSNKWI